MLGGLGKKPWKFEDKQKRLLSKSFFYRLLGVSKYLSKWFWWFAQYVYAVNYAFNNTKVVHPQLT